MAAGSSAAGATGKRELPFSAAPITGGPGWSMGMAGTLADPSRDDFCRRPCSIEHAWEVRCERHARIDEQVGEVLPGATVVS
jgi:hypothetical protein